MSLNGINASQLTPKMIESLEYLSQNLGEFSPGTKEFLNHLHEQSPEMRQHWEKYYGNLASTLQHTKKMGAENPKDECGKSRFEGGPTAQGRLHTMVENGGKATVLGGGGIVVFSGATITPPVDAKQEKKRAGSFGIIGLLGGKCPKKEVKESW